MASAAGAAGMKRKRAGPSSSSSRAIDYEVFLNFRGQDTRKMITEHLYSRLTKAGIRVYRDDEQLHAGEEIYPKLIEAIEQSTISIAIFSKNYASSKSCLMEMVHMWECRELKGQTVIPIFHDISPYDVIRQAGDFGRSFEKHEQNRVDPDTIQRWKDVFRNIGGLSGFEWRNIIGGHESQLVEKVLTRVWRALKKDDQVVTDKVVGIDLHVQEMMRKLGVVYSQRQAIKVCGEDVRVVGICGMPGVEKTTLAKVVFNKMHALFDGCSFLEGINSGRVEVFQETLIADLQKEEREPLKSSGDGVKRLSRLFNRMKVLIVLDNVHEKEQIEKLSGKLSWFGQGSRIIVTTNKKSVLKGFNLGADKDRAAEEYEVKPMGYQDALQLFRKHAFQGDAPQDVSEYESLSRDTVEAIGGLPMAIVFQANYLKERKDIKYWESNLKYLEGHPLDKGCVWELFLGKVLGKM